MRFELSAVITEEYTMLSEMAGFTLSRTIPDSVLSGVLSNAYKVYGGVVRDNNGRIVAHLINSNVPSLALSSFVSPLGTAFSAINSLQLKEINSAVSEIMKISQATMAVSGLGLAVSSIGFLFLNAKLAKIDNRLQEIAKDIKAVKSILELQERGKLITALRTLREATQITDENVKKQMLINSKQTLGEIHEHYKVRLLAEQGEFEFGTVEEYYSITALGHAMCSAELGMMNTAKEDFQDSLDIWRTASKSFVKTQVLGDNAERLLTRRYSDHVASLDIIDWMDFATSTQNGLNHIDSLRSKDPSRGIDFSRFRGLSHEETLNIGIARKLVARDRIFEGYTEQLGHLQKVNTTPSKLNGFVGELDKSKATDDCFIFISNEFEITKKY